MVVVTQEIKTKVGQAHLALDQDISSYLAKKALSVSCREGCFFCCYALVLLSLGEVELLAGALSTAVLEKTRKVGRERLSRLAREKFDPSFATNFFLERDPCPLLDGGGRCSAYSARPFACRGVLTNLSPSYCQPGAVPKLRGTERQQYQLQITDVHGPEHYLRVPWKLGETSAKALWEEERQLRGFTVVGELASMIYLLGVPGFQNAIEQGKAAAEGYLQQKAVLGGEFGFWVG